MATAAARRVDAHGAASRRVQTSEPSIVDRLKTELRGRVAETLNAVCGAFEKELELAAQPPAPPEAGLVDYDTYNDCCQRLVTYISASMATSPHFVQQMDRIILACHSSASERVLSSLQARDPVVLIDVARAVEPNIKAENVSVTG
ncbi:hypothetical protein BBJ28_00021133, partial [Nothophytophthora sp. Chile5]